jgi:sugar phosphate isomerase/epimerase
MRLGISTATAPGFTLEELSRSCRHRGLRAIELIEGHAHGLTLGSAAAEARQARRVLADAGVEQILFRPSAPAGAFSEQAVALAVELEAAVALAAPDAFAEAAPLAHWAARYAEAGSRLLLLHGTDAAEAAACREAARRVPDRTIQLGWTADPHAADLTAGSAAVLEAAGARLAAVRLAGSGPEAAASEGRGVGALMARLALRGYAGIIVLTPTSAARLPVWRVWLGRSSGWGCGSKAADASLVRLEQPMNPAQETV